MTDMREKEEMKMRRLKKERKRKREADRLRLRERESVFQLFLSARLCRSPLGALGLFLASSAKNIQERSSLFPFFLSDISAGRTAGAGRRTKSAHPSSCSSSPSSFSLSLRGSGHASCSGLPSKVQCSASPLTIPVT